MIPRSSRTKITEGLEVWTGPKIGQNGVGEASPIAHMLQPACAPVIHDDDDNDTRWGLIRALTKPKVSS